MFEDDHGALWIGGSRRAQPIRWTAGCKRSRARTDCRTVASGQSPTICRGGSGSRSIAASSCSIREEVDHALTRPIVPGAVSIVRHVGWAGRHVDRHHPIGARQRRNALVRQRRRADDRQSARSWRRSRSGPAPGQNRNRGRQRTPDEPGPERAVPAGHAPAANQLHGAQSRHPRRRCASATGSTASMPAGWTPVCAAARST